MLRRYAFWLNGAYIIQLLTGVVHAVTLFLKPEPKNATEQQLLDLMNNYQMDMGSGFIRTMNDFMMVFSASFALLYLLGGITVLFLWIRQTELAIMKGVLAIQVIIFGISFALTCAFAFMAPIVFTGLAFVFLLMAWLTIPRQLRNDE